MAHKSRTFRIFVSSTFADLRAERNELQEHVWPNLRDLCMRHGCRFQAIDLRWGVSEEAALDQQAMNICLEEIRRCQRVTPRPNFVVLLGERYGWRPIPSQVPAEEFESLFDHTPLPERERLLRWYGRDDNAVPAAYVLQPRVPGGPFDDADAWAAEERELHGILLEAARRAGLSGDDLIKYERSATEQEIREGALTTQTDHAFCYFRTIEGLPKGSAARDFVEQDTEGRRLQADLKRRLQHHFPKKQVYPYAAEWAGDGVGRAHLDALCARMEADLSAAILREIEGLEAQDALDAEVEAHKAFAADRAQHFIGRGGILGRIRDYVDSGAPHPLVIYGPSGSGKSALMAKAVAGSGSPCALVHRFIGATPDSTDVRSLLEGLCRQIGRHYGISGELPTDCRGLADELPKRLALATAEMPLVLMLDALDQLSPTDNAHTLSWLPRELPANVRVIVSVLEREGAEAGACLRSARARFPAECLVKLEPLTPQDGEGILDEWLTEAGRTLTDEQHRDILGKFAREGLPLYLKVAFEEARRWHSYDGLPCGADEVPGLFDTVDGIISDMLARLEDPRNHGRVLVSRALGYLAVARHGLTEDELLDVLSADEQVMADFRQRARYWPDAPALPVVLWSRLYLDLAPYLAERSADQASLLGFYHRQLAEAVAEEYLGEEPARSLHGGLADYFLRRPVWLSEGANGAKLPNYRMASELPHQLLRAERWQVLAGTLSDYDFTEMKAAARMTYDLVRDHSAAERGIPAGALSDAGSEALRDWRNFVSSQGYRLAAGDEPFLQLAYNHADGGAVADAAETRAAGHVKPWLRLLNRPPRQARPALLRTLEGHMGRVDGVAVTPDGRRAVSASWDATLRVWDLQTGECQRVLEGHSSYVKSVAVTADGSRAVSGGIDGSLQVWDLQTGARVRTLQGHTDPVEAVAVTPDGGVAVSGSWDKTLRLWDLQSGVCVRTLKGHTDWVQCVAVAPDGGQAVSGGKDGTVRVWNLQTGECVRALEGHIGPVESVAIAPEHGRGVSGGYDGTVRVWNLQTGALLQTLTGDPPSIVDSLALTPDGRRAVSAGGVGRAVRVWDLQLGECVEIPGSHTDTVTSVAATPDGERAVSGSADGMVRVWDLRAVGCVRALVGHESSLEAVAVTPDGRLAVSGSHDETLRVWDVQTGECLRTLEGHSYGVTSVAITVDGGRAISGSLGGGLRVWDLQTGEYLRTLGGRSSEVTSVAVATDGRRAISGSLDGALRVWDIQTGDCLRTLKGQTVAVSSVALTPDARWAVSGSEDGTVRVWDLQTGACLRTLEGHTNLVRGIAVTPDGSRAVSASDDKTLRLWDIKTSKCLWTLKGHADRVHAVAVTHDGRRAVSGSLDNTLGVWDLQTGKCVQTLVGHAAAVTSVAVTWDGGLAVSASYDRTLRVWDVKTGGSVRVQGHLRDVLTVAVTPDGWGAVSGGVDWTLQVWDVQTGEHVRTLEGHRERVITVAVTPDGRRAVSGSFDRTLRIWDLQTGECLRTLEGHTLEVFAVALTPDGRRAVSGSEDKTLRLWDVQTGKCLRTLEGHAQRVRSVAVTPDGRLAVSGSDDGTLRVWDVQTGECLRTLEGHTDWVTAIALTPDGRRAVSSGRDGARVWDLRTGECVHRWEGSVLAVTPDGRRAFSSSADKAVRVWDIQTGECLLALEEHTHGVTSGAVTPDGRWAVVGSWDETLRVRETEGGKQGLLFRAEGRPDRCAVLSSGAGIVVGTNAGRIHILSMQNLIPGPSIATGWRRPGTRLLAVGCTKCRAWSELPGSVMGTELPCPNCGQTLKLNPFVIEADWRPVARAWAREPRMKWWQFWRR